MIYEWDEDKRQSNINKHGFDFEDAAEVFEDPYGIEVIDDNNYGEERIIFIGVLRGIIVTTVTFVDRENVRRIISFRKATKNEKRFYENGYY
jgi:uncharacterized DUF497 family protein